MMSHKILVAEYEHCLALNLEKSYRS